MKNDQCLQELLVYYPRNRLWNGCLSIICPHYSTQPRTQNNPFTINRYNTFTWWSIQVPHQKTAPGDMGHDYIVAKPRITLQKAMSLHTKMTQKPQIHNNHRELTHFFGSNTTSLWLLNSTHLRGFEPWSSRTNIDANFVPTRWCYHHWHAPGQQQESGWGCGGGGFGVAWSRLDGEGWICGWM